MIMKNNKTNTRIGFIGNGNMGSALAIAVSKAGYEVLLYDPDTSKSSALAEKTKGHVASAEEIINRCGYVFLGVKPQMLATLAREIVSLLDAAKENAPVLVSMAAGTSVSRIAELFGKDRKIIRIMPNTPVAYGEGMTLWCGGEKVTEEEKSEFTHMMSLSGRLDELDEKLIDAASALSGCGPAFVYMFIEALSDGGVLCGLPRGKALTYAAQTLIGAATILMESGEHPGKLKDAVCSPGGTTIEGVRTLEEHGFRAAATDAVIAAYEKTLALAKK